jgi:tetratricopeptide (TPR) repeat protein
MSGGPWQMGGQVQARMSPPAGAPRIDQLFDAANDSFRAGRLAEADGLYREILRRDPSHAHSLHGLGLVAFRTGRFDAAVELIGRAITIDGENASFHNNIGEACRFLGRYGEAETHFARATALDPGSAESHLNLGNALEHQGRVGAAAAEYRRAIELKPDYAEAHMNLGVALMRQGEASEAAKEHRTALSLRPDFTEAHMNLGIALQGSGELQEAVAHYRLALAQRPDYAAAHFHLGHALLERGELEEGLRSYQQSLAVSSGSAGLVVADATPIESIRRAANPGRALHPVEAHWFMNLVRVNCWRSGTRHWSTLCAAALEPAGLPPAARYELLMRSAIGRWTDGDLPALAVTLQEAAGVSAAIGPSALWDVLNWRAYERYVTALQRTAGAAASASANGLPPLPVIGDSHCLTFHGIRVSIGETSYATSARLVMGCRAWHLADPAPNLYKWLFAAIIAELPQETAAICCFGEHDCRPDVGILPHYRKTGGDLAQLTSGQVDRYVDHVLAVAAPRRLALTFIGVPAPRLDAASAGHPSLSDDDKSLLIEIVRLFNASLRRAAAGHGCGYADVFAISAGPEGSASGEHHIDDVHLKPDVLPLALEATRRFLPTAAPPA